jgi:hypothetical protein
LIIAVLSGSPDIDKRLRTLFRVAQRLNQLRKKLAGVRIPTKPAMHSNTKPAAHSDLKPASVPI